MIDTHKHETEETDIKSGLVAAIPDAGVSLQSSELLFAHSQRNNNHELNAVCHKPSPLPH